MFKKFLVSLSLVLAGCFIALCLAEGMVRLFYPHARDHVIPGGLFEMDDALGWRLKANMAATHRTRYFEVLYRINSHGYRDPPRQVDKAENSYRVLLYGDSQVFGWGIPGSQRFSNLVENNGRGLEIWNQAVPGYGLDQQILSYERDGQRFRPDEVIFFASKSTLARLQYDYIFRKHKPKFVSDQRGALKLIPVPGKNNTWTDELYRVLSPLYLPYFVDRRLAMLTRGHQPGRKRSYQPVNNLILGMMLDRVSNVARERKHRVTLIAYHADSAEEALREFCKQMNIDFIAVNFEHEHRDLVFGEHDPHWNPLAQKLLAEQLHARLETRIKGR